MPPAIALPDNVNQLAIVNEPKPVHHVEFIMLDNGQIQARSTANEALTMKIIGDGMAALATAMAQQKAESKKIVPAPPGLRLPKG